MIIEMRNARSLPMLGLTSLLSWFFFCPANAIGQTEEETVIAVVQQLFDAMAEHDAELGGSVMLAEGTLVSVREDGSGIVIRSASGGDFVEQFAAMDADLLERIWDPQVLIHDRIAVVWAPYDFQLNGEFSHCGIDSFNLLKTGEGWKIASIVYTVERSGCDSAPNP